MYGVLGGICLHDVRVVLLGAVRSASRSLIMPLPCLTLRCCALCSPASAASQTGTLLVIVSTAQVRAPLTEECRPGASLARPLT